MRPQLRPVIAGCVAVVALMATAVVAMSSPADASPDAAAVTADPCAAIDPFDAAGAAALDAALGGAEVSAAVQDVSSGCQFHYGDGDLYPTASTVKVEIMGAVFLALQDQGVTSLPADLDAYVQVMIGESDNDAAQALYDWLGGGAALQFYGRRLGMTVTDNAQSGWGGEGTTPEDQLALLRSVVVGDGPLAARWVNLARGYLAGVDPSQRWGVSAGVPTGSTVWLKNGWLYNDGSMWGPADAWRLGSIGVVRLASGRMYSIAVYDDSSAWMTTGVDAIQTVATRVAAVLSAPRAATLLSARPAAAATVGAFHSIEPTRLADTRTSGVRLAPGADLVVDVAAVAPGSVAAALEVTAVDASADAFVTVFADGQAQPVASDLNPLRGRVTADLVVTPVGADGKVRVYGSRSMDVVVDLVGTWAAAPDAVAAGRLTMVAPERVLDTRSVGPGAPVAAGSVTRVPVAGLGGVPATGVAGVVVTVTATDVTRAGYWTVWSGTGDLPVASMLNVVAGDTIGNTTLVPVAPDGTVSVFSQSGGQLVVDVVGWITDATAAKATTGRLAVLAGPTRIVDTRFGLGSGRFAADGTLAVPAAAAGAPADAVGLLANLTTVAPDAAGFLTAYPAGGSLPATSTTNPSPGRDPAAAAVLSGLGAGVMDVYSKEGVDLVIDVWGWLTP